MGKIYFTSDTHFSHTNILKYENRPYKDVQDMNSQMIKNWNETVTNNDQVYILGDFCFGSKEDTMKIANQLNGQKFLIMGNHDQKVKTMSKEEKSCFGWVKDYYVLKHNNMKFVLFHFPIQVWDCKHHGSVHLYGHIHSNLGNHSMEYDIKNSYNVGVDVNNFRPIELNEIIKKIRYTG